MKKKTTGIVSILVAICIIILIIPLISSHVTKPVNQSLTTNSTNYNLASPVNYNQVHHHADYITSNLKLVNSTSTRYWIQAIENVEGKNVNVYVSVSDYLFNVTYYVTENREITSRDVSLNSALMDFYHQVGYFDKPADAVVVYPIFTQAAYGKNGFYDYYAKRCDSSCLTLGIPTNIVPVYQTSRNAYDILKLLHYDTVTDVDVDKNPNILDKYKKVIMLHNEYVTQREFDAIIHHPNVVYLYPNALYAKIQSDYDKNTITLIRGHGYPTQSADNGFDWKFDNSDFEYDLICDDWQFHTIDNGKMLDCYPTFRMYLDKELLNEIKN